MKKYKYIIFDFDGTINDTSQGIYHTFKKVLDILGINYDGVDFSRHIGPPLEFSYTELAGKKLCQRAIELHRQVFAQDNAVEMSRLYDGITDTLQKLTDSGFVLSIASSKYQPHALASVKSSDWANFSVACTGKTKKEVSKAKFCDSCLPTTVGKRTNVL